MFSRHPIKLWRYVSFQRFIVPSDLHHCFYTSWEDALWDLLRFFHFPDKSICLVPEFFCMDVVKNMEEHGLRCIFYPVNSQLQTNPETFADYVFKFKPKVVIILHTVGITNQLFSQSNIWLKRLLKGSLLIEDCVHQIVIPQQIALLTPHHFVIDSLRKVAPLYGSNLYGNATTLRNFKQFSWWLTLPYQLKVFWWWWLFQWCLHARWNKLAQKCMQKGYDLIGDSERAAPGPWFFKILSQYLHLNKIEEVKKQQVNRYQELLKVCWKNNTVYQIQFDQADARKLRGFPVGIAVNNAERLLVQLQANQLAWKYELDDCPWSKRQKIIYLPLGPHVDLTDIDLICKLLITAIKNTNSVVS